MTTGPQSPPPKNADPDRDVRIAARLMTAVVVAIIVGLIGLRAVSGLDQFRQMVTGWCEWSGPAQPGLPGAVTDCSTWATQLMVTHPKVILDCTTSLVDIHSFYSCLDQNAGPFR